ncbi:hypothetical protein BDW59DRAFT_148533 [Aspergillus cavernicola]|uniref:Rod shape-determining protein MreD n=1 Tax=Aspergillus cavernicola TaxID=176166 RepID=A0ABR4I7H7_9EURO
MYNSQALSTGWQKPYVIVLLILSVLVTKYTGSEVLGIRPALWFGVALDASTGPVT